MVDNNKAAAEASPFRQKMIYEEIVENLNKSRHTMKGKEYDSNTKSVPEEKEDSLLSCIMNDHNYVSCYRKSENLPNIRLSLSEFIKSKSLVSNRIAIPMDKLIDGILDMLSESTNYDFIIEKIAQLSENKSHKKPCTLDYKENKNGNIHSKRNLKVRKAVKEMKLKLIMDKEDNQLKVSSPEAAGSLSSPEVSPESNSSSKVNVKTEENLEPVESSTTSTTQLQADPVPLETPEIIKNLLKFAEKLQTDCIAAAKSADLQLEQFVIEKTKEYKEIVNTTMQVEASVQTDKLLSNKKLRKTNAQDKRLLLKSSEDSDSSNSSYLDHTMGDLEWKYIAKESSSSRQQKSAISEGSIIPKQPTEKLTYFRSGSSSNEDVENDDRSFTVSKNKTAQDNAVSEQNTTNSSPPIKDSTGDSDDKFIQGCDPMEMTNTSESDKENASHLESSENTLSTKSKGDEKFDEDPQGKEIERLLNLKGLADPQKNNSLTTQTKSARNTGKQMPKGDEKLEEDPQGKEIERLLNLKGLADPQKNNSLVGQTKSTKNTSKQVPKADSLFAVMQEIDENSLSDDSNNEDDEPVMTEKQFLVKCNENLKQQLLNSASSESEAFNSDDDIDLIHKSLEQSGDEDDQRVSFVDKFLERLVDDEENTLAKNELLKPASSTTSLDGKKTPLIVSTIDITNSPTSEIDTPTTRGDISQKSFEILLNNDKKQRTGNAKEDFIDLSAESCDSDVEESIPEKEEKIPRIKPMLRQDQLESGTIFAQKKEAERLRRLEKRNAFLAKKQKYRKSQLNPGDFVLDYSIQSKKFIKVHPGLVAHLKPHQVDGIKFMYDCCYGSVNDLKDHSGSGCILAHCMGLGKTLQIISLIHTVAHYKELKTSKVLVLCPKSTIMNWVDEFQRWLGPLDVRPLQVFNFSDTADIYEKINIMHRWSMSTAKAGCLIMGYEAFRSLVFYHNSKSRLKAHVQMDEIRKSISKYLLKPGADLVVCDEGHIIKNRKSGISLAAAEIVTPKRIVLTGTPIQNNLREYYSMVNFIKPLILGTEKEFANLYANPIKNGQHKDSSKRDIKVMKQRSFVLHKKLSKFVQRKEAVLLQSFLPRKFEYVLFIPMTPVQYKLYEYVLDAISKREDSRGRSLITDYTCLRKIWTHPKVLEDAWKNAVAIKNKRELKKTGSEEDQPDDIYDSQTGVISVGCDWWRNLVTDADLETIFPSNKLKTMFEIILKCGENGEKCLIFSAFVAVLNVVEYFFKVITEARDLYSLGMIGRLAGQWINGVDYYRLDGKTNKTLRHEMVKRFNDPENKRARVFLISAKAGGQGINLIGANRVIILDTSWNPANDQQNIFRIFRLGQTKNCYIYRLIAMGTMEEKVYSRSVTKQAMSFRVVDEQQIDRHYNMAELAELYTLTKPTRDDQSVPVFPQDQVLAHILLTLPDLVFKYHEHDSLLENKVEQELSEQEKADAWLAYERDLQLNSETRQVNQNFNGYPLFGQMNYPMYPMPNFDPKGFQGLNQMDFATRNALGTPLLPGYVRDPYFDFLNMYKNFPGLLNDKNTSSRFNPNFGMPLAPGLMNNPPICNSLPSNDPHMPPMSNPYFPFHSHPSVFSGSSLNTNPILSNQSVLNVGPDRFDPSKSVNLTDDNIASAMNSYSNSLPTFSKDVPGVPLQQKDNFQNPPPGFSLPPVSLANSLLPGQNIFSPNMGKETISRNAMQKKRTKNLNKPMYIPNEPNSETHHGNQILDTINLSSPEKSHSSQESGQKLPDQIGMPLQVNRGLPFSKPMSMPLSPVPEISDTSNIIKSGNSMQIIPTLSPASEDPRKKFDNISPNISLTALCRPPPATPENAPPNSSTSLDLNSSNKVRKRRYSGDNLMSDNDRESVRIELSNPPAKLAK